MNWVKPVYREGVGLGACVLGLWSTCTCVCTELLRGRVGAVLWRGARARAGRCGGAVSVCE